MFFFSSRKEYQRYSDNFYAECKALANNKIAVGDFKEDEYNSIYLGDGSVWWNSNLDAVVLKLHLPFISKEQTTLYVPNNEKVFCYLCTYDNLSAFSKPISLKDVEDARSFLGNASLLPEGEYVIKDNEIICKSITMEFNSVKDYRTSIHLFSNICEIICPYRDIKIRISVNGDFIEDMSYFVEVLGALALCGTSIKVDVPKSMYSEICKLISELEPKQEIEGRIQVSIVGKSGR